MLKKYWGLIAPLLIAAIFIGVYFSYWKIVGNKIINEFTNLKSEKLKFKTIEINGFPYRHEITIDNLDVKLLNGNFQTSKLTLSASPFNSMLWVLNSAQNPIFNLQNNKKYQLKPIDLQASIHFNLDANLPKIKRFSLIAKQIEINDGVEKFPLNNLDIHLLSDDKNNDYAFSIALMGLNNFEPFKSNKFQPEILRGLIKNAKDLDKGYESWRKINGNIEIKFGQVQMNDWGIFEYGTLNNLMGNLHINDNNKFDGQIYCDANLTIFSDNKISIPKTKLEIKNSQIDLKNTFANFIGK